MLFFLAEEVLGRLGVKRVLHAPSIREALDLLDREKPDVAMLDVNVGGEYVYPVARRLSEVGVPFVFATGYSADFLAAEWLDRPILPKPYRDSEIERALAAVLGEPFPRS